MPEKMQKAVERMKRSFIPQWIRENRRRLLISSTIVLLLVLFSRPLFYTVTHFQAVDCGSFNGLFATNAEEAQQGTQCFLHAHQQCQAATLEVLYQGVDSGGRVTFRTANSIGNCTLSVIGYATRCIIPVCSFVPYVDNNCLTATQQEDGFHLGGCGKWPQDFIVPTKPR